MQQQNPEMETWKEVTREDGAYMISSTGKEKSHAGALTVTETALTYTLGSTKTGVGAFVLEYNRTQLTIRHTYFGGLQDVVAFAAPILEALPYNINCDQLLAIYQSQRVLNEEDQYILTYAEGGVQYSLIRDLGGRNTELTI